jgi:hypothetical protein
MSFGIGSSLALYENSSSRETHLSEYDGIAGQGQNCLLVALDEGYQEKNRHLACMF